MQGPAIFHEHERMARAGSHCGEREIPDTAFDWLMTQTGPWLTLEAVNAKPVLKCRQYVGVIRTPCGFVLEILPKTGKAGQPPEEARRLLLSMLATLPETQSLILGDAAVSLAKLPLLQVFLKLALDSFRHVVLRGLRRDYVAEAGNLTALRGKLVMGENLRRNLVHRERFYTHHDEYSANRPENRLLVSAVAVVRKLARHPEHQFLAHELCQRLEDVPPSPQVQMDFQRVRLDRGMSHYRPALAWARLLLLGQTPLLWQGGQEALSLLFDMNRLFEYFVAACLEKQIPPDCRLEMQLRRHHLVEFRGKPYGELRPDLVVMRQRQPVMVLDTKWKLLDDNDVWTKVSQNDLYQMQAYGLSYLSAQGRILLVYPATPAFRDSTGPLHFLHVAGVQVWLIPFCLETHCLLDAPEW